MDSPGIIIRTTTGLPFHELLKAIHFENKTLRVHSFRYYVKSIRQFKHSFLEHSAANYQSFNFLIDDSLQKAAAELCHLGEGFIPLIISIGLKVYLPEKYIISREIDWHIDIDSDSVVIIELQLA